MTSSLTATSRYSKPTRPDILTTYSDLSEFYPQVNKTIGPLSYRNFGLAGPALRPGRIGAAVDGSPRPVDDVGCPLGLQAFPFCAAALDAQPSVGRHGDQFVTGQVVHIVDDVDQVRRDPSRSQLPQGRSQRVGKPDGGVVGQLPRTAGPGGQSPCRL